MKIDPEHKNNKHLKNAGLLNEIMLYVITHTHANIIKPN